MKKPYQIESQRAVNRLEEMAADGNPAVQMILPLAEMMGWLRKGVAELIRQAVPMTTATAGPHVLCGWECGQADTIPNCKSMARNSANPNNDLSHHALCSA